MKSLRFPLKTIYQLTSIYIKGYSSVVIYCPIWTNDYDKKVQTVMVNNFTNINKTSNHLSPYITEHKKETTYDVGNSGPDLGQT